MARKKIATVGNPISRISTVKISGRDKTLEFNFLAYTAFHKLTGISLVKGVKFGELEADEMIALLYAGLLTHDKDVDIEKLMVSLNGADFDAIYPDVVEACKQSFPPPAEIDPENPTKPIAN